ncbi:MAG: hypothetical protein AB1422_17570 [bacterium]
MPAHAIKSEEIIPPYYDRYLDEREKRFVTEIEAMRSEIRRNTQQLETIIAINTQRLDARIDGLHTRIDETNKRIDELKEYVIMRFDETDKRIDGLDKSVNARIDGLDKRIEGLDQRLSARIDGLDKRIDGLDQRLNARIDNLTKKVDSHFYWTMGLFAPLVISVITGIIFILIKG